MPDTEEQKQEKKKRKPDYKRQVDRIKDQRARDSRQFVLKCVGGLICLGAVGAMAWAGISQMGHMSSMPQEYKQPVIDEPQPTPTFSIFDKTGLDEAALDKVKGALSVITPMCFLGGLGLLIYARS